MSTGLNNEHRLRLLLLEDNPVDAKVCLFRLERAGFRVVPDVVETTEDFQTCLAGKDYDLILSDYALQGWTGLDALQILKQSGHDIPFILVTGTLGEETAVKCIKMGAADYVLKDRLARLPIAVKQALDERALRGAKQRAEESLRLSNENTEAILHSISDAFFALDLEGHFTYLNPKAEQLFRGLQRTRRELRNRAFWDEFPLGIVSYFEAALRKAISSKESSEFEAIFPHSGQHYTFRVYAIAQGVTVYGRDITEQRHLHTEQEKLIEDLKTALGNVRRLSGLLPMCASCKKIRDDRGYWNQIEKYLHEHAEVTFTHGLCPDCAQTLYPELVERMAAKGKLETR